MLPVKVAFNSLDGLYFHTFQNGERNWQGKVIGQVNNQPFIYKVQLYSWLTGNETDVKFVDWRHMQDWVFYTNYEDWLYQGELSIDDEEVVTLYNRLTVL